MQSLTGEMNIDLVVLVLAQHLVVEFITWLLACCRMLQSLQWDFPTFYVVIFLDNGPLLIITI